MKHSLLYYSVGPLLYCPAHNETLAASVISQKFGKQFSLAVCLEDTIRDDSVAKAEHTLTKTITDIWHARQTQNFYLPSIFIRVRSSEQIPRLLRSFGDASTILTGFIIPKFSIGHSDDFIQEIVKANESSAHSLYMMPIYESSSIIDLRSRYDILYALKEKLDKVEDLVLNIRVGGNDLCHMFGYRRHVHESIHQIAPIANIFSDILTVYGMDYVVSGPVWEYYNGEQWEAGLKKELTDDRLCGFVGKTVIHPNQIEIVNRAYQVSRQDFEDAKMILNWNPDKHTLVSGSFKNERMNEYKTHWKWAQKILFLAEQYGITNE